MLEKNQRFKSLLYVLADAALLFIGFLLANYIRFNYVRYFEPGGTGPALAVARDPRNIIAGLATSLVLVLIYWSPVSTAPRGCAAWPSAAPRLPSSTRRDC